LPALSCPLLDDDKKRKTNKQTNKKDPDVLLTSLGKDVHLFILFLYRKELNVEI